MIYLDPTIIVFLVALLGIIIMIVLKAFELRSGKKSLLSRIGEGTDHIVHAVYDNVKFCVNHINVHNLIVLMQWIAVHVLSSLRSMYIWLYHLAHRHPHSKKVIDMVRGKGEVDSNGGSSFYLKQISRETEEIVADEEKK